MSRTPPEMVHVAIRMPDETVAIMGFVTKEFTPDGVVRYERLATAAAIDAEIERTFPDQFSVEAGTIPPWRFVVSADVPSDRTYRNAWRDDGATIYHDMPAARELHREMLRAARAPLLAQLDVDYMRALEAGSDTQPIVADKVTLRDITEDERIDAAQTIDELKAIAIDG